MPSKVQSGGDKAQSSVRRTPPAAGEPSALQGRQQPHPAAIIHGAMTGTRPVTPQSLLHLQPAIGNRAVGRLLSAARGPHTHHAGSGMAGATAARIAPQAVSPAPRAGVIQRAPQIPVTDEAMGQHIVDQVNAINAPRTAKSGVHYAHNYQRFALAYRQNPQTHAKYKDYADFWKEDYWSGYADPDYFERKGFMSWELKPMVSAAEGIKAWLKGPTIAECASALVAIEIDTMRAAMGDDKFDALFSDWPNADAKKGRLRINQSAYTSSSADYMGKTNEAILSLYGKDKVGSRSVNKGEWYYFYNHPKYLLKHPGGAFQGENAICMDATPGAQKWAGMGVSSVTEEEMLNTMVTAYNAPRNERDYEVLLSKFAPGALSQKTDQNTYQSLYMANRDKVPDEYREDKGVFPDTIDLFDLVADPEYTINGVKRKGGFVSGGGKKLNVQKVKAAREG